jgi:hypothetical protein
LGWLKLGWGSPLVIGMNNHEYHQKLEKGSPSISINPVLHNPQTLAATGFGLAKIRMGITLARNRVLQEKVKALEGQRDKALGRLLDVQYRILKLTLENKRLQAQLTASNVHFIWNSKNTSLVNGSGASRNSLQLRNEIYCWDLQGVSDLMDLRQGDVLVTALDMPHVASINTSSVSQGLLRETFFLSYLANFLAKSDQYWIFHIRSAQKTELSPNVGYITTGYIAHFCYSEVVLTQSTGLWASICGTTRSKNTGRRSEITPESATSS